MKATYMGLEDDFFILHKPVFLSQSSFFFSDLGKEHNVKWTLKALTDQAERQHGIHLILCINDLQL